MNKKKYRNTKRKNQPVKRQPVTKAKSKPAETTKSPIPQSLLNTAGDSTVKDSVEILNLLRELNYGNNQSTQEIGDRIYRVYNIPGPNLWRSRLINSALIRMSENAELSDKQKREIQKRFVAIGKQNPEAFNVLETIGGAIFMDEDALYNDLTGEQIERAMKFIPLDSIDGVTFYHGTSYENYLQIKADGFIRRSNYADYQDKKSAVREKYFKNQTGYVFLSDSIDKSLSFSFGGIRDVLLDYKGKKRNANDYFSKQTGTKLNKNNIGVIFEFGAKGYNVFYTPEESNFVVDRDISLADIDEVRFFYVNNNFQINEITESEIKERGIE